MRTYRSEWAAAADIDEFLRTTIPVLAAEPARNTLPLTIFDQLRSGGPHAFGIRDPQLLTWYDAEGAAVGAIVRTPPYFLVLSDVPIEAVPALVDLILDPGSGLDSPQIDLPGSCVAAFATAWTACTGNGPRVVERFRLYRLGELVEPKPMPTGGARLATKQDTELVTRYLEEFLIEAEPSAHDDPRATALRMGEARIAEGTIWLWADESGTPVSLAGHTPIVAGMGRVGPVYTPPERRGRGYAAGATVAASRALLDQGVGEVLLFTDLANPTSNRLYQRLGYRPVSDRARLELKR